MSQLAISLQYLTSLGDGDLEAVIWSRLRRQQVDGLPKLHKNEDPEDIISDLIAWEYTPEELKTRLRDACFRILERIALERIIDVDATVSLIFLAASMNVGERAVSSLTELVAREDTNIRHWSGQSIRMAALRCLPSLICRHPASATPRLKELCERLVNEQEYLPLALTILVLCEPHRKDELAARFCTEHFPTRSLDIYLHLAGALTLEELNAKWPSDEAA